MVLRGVALIDGGGENGSWSVKRRRNRGKGKVREAFDGWMRLEFWLSSSSSYLLPFPSQSTNDGARSRLLWINENAASVFINTCPPGSQMGSMAAGGGALYGLSCTDGTGRREGHTWP